MTPPACCAPTPTPLPTLQASWHGSGCTTQCDSSGSGCSTTNAWWSEPYTLDNMYDWCVDARGDSALAQALAVAGLLANGETRTNGTDSVATTFPGFFETLRSLREKGKKK